MFTRPAACLVRKAQAACEVAREDRRQQAVARLVGHRDRHLERVDLDDRRDRPEGLLGRRERRRRNAVEDRRRPVEAGREAVGPPAAGHHPRTARDGILDMLVHLLGDRLVVQRPERGLAQHRVAELRRGRGASGQQLHKLPPHSRMHQDSLSGRAALARAEKAADHRRVGSRLEVSVLEHDQRTVAAHLEQQPLAGCALGDPQAGRRRADEADGRGPGVCDQLVTHDRTGTRDEVEDARRQVGLPDTLRQQRRAVCGARRRRPDDRVAGRERGRDDLGRHRVGPVPGRDYRHRPNRPAHHQDALPGHRALRDRTLDPNPVLSRAVPHRDQLVDLVVGLAQRLALVERRRGRELVTTIGAAIGHAVKHSRPRERRLPLPEPGGGHRSPHRVTRVGASSLSDLAQLLAGRGAGGGEGRSGFRLAPAAVDQQARAQAVSCHGSLVVDLAGAGDI